MSRSLILRTALIAGVMAVPLASASAEVSITKSNHSAITVLAPRIVTKRAEDGIGQVQTITASSLVNYDDLDLQSASGRSKLKQRVNSAAKELCSKLDSMYPLANGSDQDFSCVRDAVHGARPQVEAAFAHDRPHGLEAAEVK